MLSLQCPYTTAMFSVNSLTLCCILRITAEIWGDVWINALQISLINVATAWSLPKFLFDPLHPDSWQP